MGLSWMAWTGPTAGFFIFIGAILSQVHFDYWQF